MASFRPCATDRQGFCQARSDLEPVVLLGQEDQPSLGYRCPLEQQGVDPWICRRGRWQVCQDQAPFQVSPGGMGSTRSPSLFMCVELIGASCDTASVPSEYVATYPIAIDRLRPEYSLSPLSVGQ